ncbi:MAG: S8 family serine peptidase, partial [Vicinamibacterales bacterium]
MNLPKCSRFLTALFALLAIAGSATTATAQDKLDRALSDGKRAGTSQRVIVKATPGYESWARALLVQKGKIIQAELPSIGAFAVTLSAAELDLCRTSVLAGCSEDSRVSPSGVATDATLQNWSASSLSSAASLNTLLGTLGLTPSANFGVGVTVALIDSGIYPSAAFGNRIKAFYDFTSGGTRSRPAFDDYGHGTHVAGLIGGLQSALDAEYQGVAPSVNFVGLKVLDQNGGGRTSDVIRAIEFAIANKKKFGIDIINLSLGHPIFEAAATDPLVQVVEKASLAGIIVVASAGNHGTNASGEVGFAGITSPGNAPSALTVGAAKHQGTISRTDDRMAAYSSNGPTWYDGLIKPDFVAPGHLLV